MTIGERIKQRREELNLSQEELAHMLGLKGRSSVSKAEKSGDTMTSTLIKVYADALQCSPAYLLGYGEMINQGSYSHESAALVAKIRSDAELSDALKIYFSLPKNKKKYVCDLIKMLSD